MDQSLLVAVRTALAHLQLLEPATFIAFNSRPRVGPIFWLFGGTLVRIKPKAHRPSMLLDLATTCVPTVMSVGLPLHGTRQLRLSLDLSLGLTLAALDFEELVRRRDGPFASETGITSFGPAAIA